MRIAVLGSGAGGCAVAFDFARHGHEVRLFDFERFGDTVRAIREQGGISAEGRLEGFAPVARAGHDAGEALAEAGMVFAVGPAYATRPFAEACRPHLEPGQVVVVCPGSCGGALEWKQALGLGPRDGEILVAETSTLPYAVRLPAPGRIRVHLKLEGGVFLAALPAGETRRVLDRVRDVYPAITAAENVLQTSLQNGNPVIHPAITLLNAARIEGTGGELDFYGDGVTPAVGRLMRAVDEERIALGERLGLEILPDPVLGCRQGYMTEATYDAGYSRAPGFAGIRAQGSLDHRYLHEDVGYGLVFLESLADELSVAVPTISAVVRVASVLTGRDYLTEAPRTMASLGLAGRSAEELAELVS